MGGMTQFPKTCTQCGIEKPPGAFHVADGMRDGRMNQCKECKATYQAERRKLVGELLKGETTEEGVVLRGFDTCSVGIVGPEAKAMRRDEYIIALGAAIKRWRHCDDVEDRDGARAALVYRAKQVVEADRRCGE